MNVKPTPEELMGYADGQLDPEHSKRIEHAIAAHPDLRAIIEDHRRTRAAARHALSAMSAAPMSPGLAKLAETLNAPHAASRPPRVAEFAWPAAAAACLAVGLATGMMVTGGGDVVRWREGPSAGTQLARVLETRPSGVAGEVIVVASFEAADGRYCRQFEIEAAADGLACKGAKGWDVLAFARRPGGAGSYQAASGADPVGIAVAGLEPGPRIEGEAERSLIGKGWKR